MQDEQDLRNKRQRTNERKRKQRMKEEYRRKEQEKNTRVMKIARQNQDRRREEQNKDTTAHQLARQAQDSRRDEQTRDTTAHQLTRHDQDRRREEQIRNTLGHQMTRQDQDRRREEQIRNTLGHQMMRQDQDRRREEEMKNTTAHQLARLSIGFEILRQQYETNIKNVPTIVYNSCNGLLFETSIKERSINSLYSKGVSKEFIIALCPSIPNDVNLCLTCFREINQNKIPKLCAHNGFAFNPLPTELQNLTTLEERMVSPRIPFMQIRPLGIDKQYGLQGNVVNVPLQCLYFHGHLTIHKQFR